MHNEDLSVHTAHEILKVVKLLSPFGLQEFSRDKPSAASTGNAQFEVWVVAGTDK